MGRMGRMGGATGSLQAQDLMKGKIEKDKEKVWLSDYRYPLFREQRHTYIGIKRARAGVLQCRRDRHASTAGKR